MLLSRHELSRMRDYVDDYVRRERRQDDETAELLRKLLEDHRERNPEAHQ